MLTIWLITTNLLYQYKLDDFISKIAFLKPTQTVYCSWGAEMAAA